MIKVNGADMPMQDMSGVLVLETPDGHQSWALIVDATVEYGDAEFTGDEAPQMKVIATMKPGEYLRSAITIDAGEENVLVYSRLLVAMLREERDRYAELERKLFEARREASRLREDLADAERDQVQMLHGAWRDGASTGWMMTDTPPHEMLAMNPHQLPDDDDETEGCHICGGPDH